MTHDTAFIIALVMCGVPALSGSGFVKHKTGSAFLGFITGIICGAIGLSLAVAILGIKQ